MWSLRSEMMQCAQEINAKLTYGSGGLLWEICVTCAREDKKGRGRRKDPARTYYVSPFYKKKK